MGVFVKGKEFLNSKPDKNHQSVNKYARYLHCTKNLDVKLPINEWDMAQTVHHSVGIHWKKLFALKLVTDKISMINY